MLTGKSMLCELSSYEEDLTSSAKRRWQAFYKVQLNAPINLINDATKIVGLPEIPRFEVTGEYWADKKEIAETATTVGVAVLTGGAGLASDLLIIASSAGNMAEAATGTDFRTGEQLSTTDRAAARRNWRGRSIRGSWAGR
ncbi:MAG: hypothetical protein WKF84_30455 [Pyrinomonadaceae bacterium]